MGLLGNAAPSAEFLKEFLLAVSLLGNVALLLWNLATRNRPQKRDVTLVGDYVCESDFEKHVGEDKQEHLRLHGRISQAKDELHEKINKVDREVAGLAEINKLQTTHILRTEGKVDRLLERSPRERETNA